jgi:glyoxylate utilization-related uncharacterized protein
MAYKTQIDIAMEGTGWKEFKGIDQLPTSSHIMIKSQDIFRSQRGWFKAFYNGDVNTTEKWIIVTPDGGYYKVFAKYMIWCHDEGASACWTTKSMKAMLFAKFKGLKMPFDPDYQT